MFAGPSSILLMVLFIIVAKAQLNMKLDDYSDDEDEDDGEYGDSFSPDDLENAFADYSLSEINEIAPNKTDNFDDVTVNETKGTLWEDREIPYRISGNFSGNQRRLIAAAMYWIHNKTCIKFVSCTNRSAHYVNLQVRNGTCNSFVGSVKRNQKLYLTKDCFVGIGSILHEMLHLIGIGHEHSRPDRDEHIELASDETIERAKIKKKNFDIREWGEIEDACEDYDVGSIMHYRSSNRGIALFSYSGDESVLKTIGQRNLPSKTDIRKVNRMYKCEIADIKVRRQIQNIENEISRFVPDLMKRCKTCTEREKKVSCMKLLTQLLYC